MTIIINQQSAQSITVYKARGAAGVGVPEGGTTGQFLRKNTDTSYDTTWDTLVFDDVSDVAITTPSTNQYLQYNGTNWINQSFTQSLDSLSDAVITTPSTNQYLQYNGTNWVNQSFTQNLDSLSDVSASSPTTDAALVWNGSAWTPIVQTLQTGYTNGTGIIATTAAKPFLLSGSSDIQLQINYTGGASGFSSWTGFYTNYAPTAGSYTNVWHQYIYENKGASASITNQYGLYVDTLDGATNNYALYTNGGLNRFGDQLFIDGSADRTQLIVEAHSTQTTVPVNIRNSSGTSKINIRATSTDYSLNVNGSNTFGGVLEVNAANTTNVAFFKGSNNTFVYYRAGDVGFQATARFQDSGGTTRFETGVSTSSNISFVKSISSDLELYGTNTLTATITSTSLTFADAKNIVVNATTGTKIGTATSQKLGFWNATPIVQPTTAVAAATFVANTSGIANDTATFDGYTIGQVVKALRNTGILA